MVDELLERFLDGVLKPAQHDSQSNVHLNLPVPDTNFPVEAAALDLHLTIRFPLAIHFQDILEVRHQMTERLLYLLLGHGEFAPESD